MPTQPTQIIGTRGTTVFEWDPNANGVPANAIRQTVRRVVLRQCTGGIKLVFVNWKGGAESAINILAATVKIAGTYYPVTFGGQGTATVVVDSHLVSDAILSNGNPLALLADFVDAELITRYSTANNVRCGLRTLSALMGDRGEEGTALPDRTQNSDAIPLISDQTNFYFPSAVIGDVAGRFCSLSCIGDSINIFQVDNLQGTGYPSIFCNLNGIPSTVMGAGGSGFGDYMSMRSGGTYPGIAAAYRAFEVWTTGAIVEYSINNTRLGASATSVYAAHKANITILINDNPQWRPPAEAGAAGPTGTGFGVAHTTQTTFDKVWGPGGAGTTQAQYQAASAERRTFNQLLRTQARGDIAGVVGVFDAVGDGYRGTYPGIEEVPDTNVNRRDWPEAEHDLHPNTGMRLYAAQGDCMTLFGQPRRANPQLLYAFVSPDGKRIELQYVVYRGSAPLSLSPAGENLSALGLIVTNGGLTIPIAAAYVSTPTSITLVLSKAVDTSKAYGVSSTGPTHGVQDASGNRASVMPDGIRYLARYDKSLLCPERIALGQWETVLNQTSWPTAPGAVGNTTPWAVVPGIGEGTVSVANGVLSLDGRYIEFTPSEGFGEVITRVRVLLKTRNAQAGFRIAALYNPTYAPARVVGTHLFYGGGVGTQVQNHANIEGYEQWDDLGGGARTLSSGEFFWYEVVYSRPLGFNQAVVNLYTAGTDGSLPVDASRQLSSTTYIDDNKLAGPRTPRAAGTVVLSGSGDVYKVEIAKSAAASPFTVTGGHVDAEGTFVQLDTDVTTPPLLAAGSDGWEVGVNGQILPVAHVGADDSHIYLILPEGTRIAKSDIVSAAYDGDAGGGVSDSANPRNVLPAFAALEVTNDSTQLVSAKATGVNLTAGSISVTPGTPVALTAQVLPLATIGVAQKVSFTAAQGALTNVANLTATWTAPSAPGVYQITATHASGKAGTVSITVAAAPVPAGPQISVQPVGGVMDEGEVLPLKVAFSGVPLASVQWRRNLKRITGATAGTYNAMQGGSYDAIVTNSQGQVISSVAVVRVSTAPESVSIVADSSIVAPGKSVTLQAYATLGSGRVVRWPVLFRMSGGPGEVVAEAAGVDGVTNSATYTAPTDVTASQIAKVTASVDPTAYPDYPHVSGEISLTVQPSGGAAVSTPAVFMGRGTTSDLTRITAADGPVRFYYYADIALPENAQVQLHLKCNNVVATYEANVLFGPDGLVTAEVAAVPAAGSYLAAWEVNDVIYPLGNLLRLKVSDRLEVV